MTDEPIPRQELLQALPEAARLEIVRQMISSLSPDSRELLLGELAKDNEIRPKETTIQLNGYADGVRIEFGRPIAWMNVPRAHGLRLAMMLLEACGARVEKAQNPTEKPPITI